MKVLVLILLVGGLMLSSCGGSSSKNNANVKEVNPADTIYLGPFDTDSICDYASQAMLKEHGQPRPCSFKFVRLYVNSCCL